MYLAHLMVHDSADRQKVLDVLDATPEVLNWRAAAGGVFLVTLSSTTSDHLGRVLAPKLPNIKFVIADIRGSRAQGMADDETWNFINSPRPAP